MSLSRALVLGTIVALSATIRAAAEDPIRNAVSAPSAPNTIGLFREIFSEAHLPGPFEEARKGMLLSWSGNHADNERKSLLALEKSLQLPPDPADLTAYQTWVGKVADATSGFEDYRNRTGPAFIQRRTDLAARSAALREEFSRVLERIDNDRAVARRVSAASGKADALRRDARFYQSLPTLALSGPPRQRRNFIEAIRIVARSGDLDEARAYLTANGVTSK